MVKEKRTEIEIKVERKFNPKNFHKIVKEFDSKYLPGNTIPLEIYVVDELCRECNEIKRASFEGHVVCIGIKSKHCEPLGVNWEW